MYVLCGLGNPGIRYAPTRHNFGFKAIERVALAYKISFNQQKFNALYGLGQIEEQKVILLKPLTYMNESGLAVKQCLDYYRVPIENLLVFYDDIDLPLGAIRVRAEGGTGTHNGMKSLMAHLKDRRMARVRLGVGPQPAGVDSADHVMNSFLPQEWDLVEEVLAQMPELANFWLRKGTEPTMNEFNRS